ncbi:hypothetical protein AGLY_009930 [Aphis glycines]|uniref:Uncharacterized protein n=1 Tax=Aphis glycines TaxID=307491 RepID=A0A6G0TFZ4_APHGL|nr:hypothetical protein AGLY_009930 [Aphis glycines]
MLSKKLKRHDTVLQKFSIIITGTEFIHVIFMLQITDEFRFLLRIIFSAIKIFQLFSFYRTVSKQTFVRLDPCFVINDSIPNITSNTTDGWSHDNAYKNDFYLTIRLAQVQHYVQKLLGRANDKLNKLLNIPYVFLKASAYIVHNISSHCSVKPAGANSDAPQFIHNITPMIIGTYTLNNNSPKFGPPRLMRKNCFSFSNVLLSLLLLILSVCVLIVIMNQCERARNSGGASRHSQMDINT